MQIHQCVKQKLFLTNFIPTTVPRTYGTVYVCTHSSLVGNHDVGDYDLTKERILRFEKDVMVCATPVHYF